VADLLRLAPEGAKARPRHHVLEELGREIADIEILLPDIAARLGPANATGKTHTWVNKAYRALQHARYELENEAYRERRGE
jgi:hypothetical protein